MSHAELAFFAQRHHLSPPALAELGMLVSNIVMSSMQDLQVALRAMPTTANVSAVEGTPSPVIQGTATPLSPCP